MDATRIFSTSPSCLINTYLILFNLRFKQQRATLYCHIVVNQASQLKTLNESLDTTCTCMNLQQHSQSSSVIPPKQWDCEHASSRCAALGLVTAWSARKIANKHRSSVHTVEKKLWEVSVLHLTHLWGTNRPHSAWWPGLDLESTLWSPQASI